MQKSKKNNYIFATVLIVIFFVIIGVNRDWSTEEINFSLEEIVYRDVSYPQVEAKIGGQKVSLAVAHTEELRALGLSGVSRLSEGEGMLFPFPKEGSHAFWMKDTLMSLDIIWIDSDGIIVHIEPNVAPETYPQKFGEDIDSQYVVELRAGGAAELRIEIGETFQLL
jgi:uncharacterized membrane protein (UPF0127 family)